MEHIAETEAKYQPGNLKKEVILDRLRRKGCRITRQRELLIDVIFQENCSCCKEIYFTALKKDPNIGMATIYRMMNLLEEIGALRWRNEYLIGGMHRLSVNSCTVELDNEVQIDLDPEQFRQVLERGLESCGYLNGGKIRFIFVPEENGEDEKISQEVKNG